MRKRSRPTKLLLDKEIVKILSTTVKFAGGALKTYPSDPPEECFFTSENVQTCTG